MTPFPRSLLFVPANRGDMFARAWESGAEAVIFDLEDSVPADQKDAARKAVETLQPPSGWTKPIFARLNAHGSDHFQLDVRAAAHSSVTGLVLPKVERASDVQDADKALASVERRERPFSLVLLIETPGGVMRMAEIADCGVARVAAFAFGGEDYRAGIGVTALDPALAEFARCSVVNGAAAVRLPSIDSPEHSIDNPDRLRASAKRSRALGFHSKFAIHPSQVPVIHEEFLSGAEDRAWAMRAVEAYERAAGGGKGSVAVDGRMIDEATMKRARAILEA